MVIFSLNIFVPSENLWWPKEGENFLRVHVFYAYVWNTDKNEALFWNLKLSSDANLLVATAQVYFIYEPIF